MSVDSSSKMVSLTSSIGCSGQTQPPNTCQTMVPRTDKSVAKLDSLDSPTADASVLVLFTGGTIGMKLDAGVYIPRQSFLIDELRNSSVFNDHNFIQSNCDDAPLMLPPTKAGRHIKYVVQEYTPLLDSSDMTMAQWNQIAADIHKNYDDFDGFIVLHGTDTMAYTASALSFMCENLGKPIILTGSQIPIFEIRSDGRDNFLTSLVIAGTHCIPEVMIYFNDKLFRGNRCIKVDNSSLSAFESPNMPPLASVKININVDWPAVFRSGTTEKFTVHSKLCENVGVLRLFPSITVPTIKAFLQPPMQGVVLQTYGAGNAPSQRKELIQLFREATNWGVIMVNVTQCERGSVSQSYNTGKVLMDAGVIPCGDMTTEAALCKLSYVLGKDSWSLEMKRKMMGRNLRGEMEVMSKNLSSVQDFELLESIAKTMSISTKEVRLPALPGLPSDTQALWRLCVMIWKSIMLPGDSQKEMCMPIRKIGGVLQCDGKLITTLICHEIVQLRDTLYPFLMCSAAKLGCVQTLEKLRQSGVNISAGDYEGRTPLHIAASEGHFIAVQYLLSHGASIHVRDRNAHTPLYDAVNSKSVEVVHLLVKTGATLTSALPASQLAMELCSSAAQNDVTALNMWMEAGADLDTADFDQRTPLHVAVSNRSQEAIDFLISHGASKTKRDSHGSTPLELAKHLYEDVVHLFT